MSAGADASAGRLHMRAYCGACMVCLRRLCVRGVRCECVLEWAYSFSDLSTQSEPFELEHASAAVEGGPGEANLVVWSKAVGREKDYSPQ